MAKYTVNPDRIAPICFEGDWHAPGETFDANPPAKALYHQNDRLAQTLSDYLRLGLVTAV